MVNSLLVNCINFLSIFENSIRLCDKHAIFKVQRHFILTKQALIQCNGTLLKINNQLFIVTECNLLIDINTHSPGLAAESYSVAGRVVEISFYHIIFVAILYFLHLNIACNCYSNKNCPNWSLKTSSKN